jgi:hypothetical protein
MHPDSTPAESVPVRVVAAPDADCADPVAAGADAGTGVDDEGRAEALGDDTVPADTVPADAGPVDAGPVDAGPADAGPADTARLAVVLADTAGPDDDGAGVDGDDPHAASTANAATPRRIRADR